jgi:putative FmdB family regulatory protein
MPTYDYECDACGHRFERFEGVHELHIKPCPKCHKKKARRLVGMGAGLIFKGAGFYTTDYKRAGAGPAEKSASPAASKPVEQKKTTRRKKEAH